MAQQRGKYKPDSSVIGLPICKEVRECHSCVRLVAVVALVCTTCISIGPRGFLDTLSRELCEQKTVLGDVL
jgi:hypothetical protein